MRPSLILALLPLIGAYRHVFQHRRLSSQSCTSMERPVDLPRTQFEQQLLPREKAYSQSSSQRKPKRYIHPQVIKMFNRAQYLIQIGDNSVAMKLLKRCLELNPFDSHSWLALARLESRLGNIHRAREVFQLASINCPRNIHLLHAWGHFEQKHGNEGRARECWSEAMQVSRAGYCPHPLTCIQLEPLNAYVAHALSNLEIRQRNFDQAKEVLERVVWQKPTSAICVSLAELERQQGHPELAKRVLEHGLRRCSKDRTQLLLALAWVEEDCFRNIDKAYAILDEAIDEDPKDVKVYIAKVFPIPRQYS